MGLCGYNNFVDEEINALSGNTNITMKSGTVYLIAGGSRNCNDGDFTGTASISVSGSAVIESGIWAGTINAINGTMGNAEILIAGGTINAVYSCIGSNTGGIITGDSKVTVIGGQITTPSMPGVCR